MKKLLMVVFAGVLAGLLGLGFSQSALGHDRLTEADPAADSVLSESPTELVLTFSARPMEEGKAVIVTDTQGTNWATGVISHRDNSIVAELTSPLPTEVYKVQWRVASSDSHVISDEYYFTVELPGESAPEVPSDNGEVQPQPETDSSLWVYVMGIAGTIVLVGVIALLIRKAAQK